MNVADVLVRALGALIGLFVAAWFVVVSADLGTGFARFEQVAERRRRRAAQKEERRD